jgi:NitT/TauT family transport system substrate-binding protein
MRSIVWLWLLVAFASNAQAVDKLKVGLHPWIGYGAAVVARDKGLFQKEDLAVETVTFAGSGSTLAPLVAGQIDIAFSSLHQLALAAGKGTDNLVAIFLLDTSNGADAVVAAREIAATAQLRGRKVAVAFDEVNHMLLLSALAAGGLKPEDVQMVNMSAEDAGAALLAGKVDGAVTWEPWVTRARANGSNVLFTSAHTPNLILNAVIVTKETFQKKGPQLAKLLRGIDAGHRYISDKPAEAKAVIAKWLKVKPAEVDTMLAGDRIYGLGENRVLFGHQERPGPAYGSMARVVEFVKSRGLATRPIDPKTLLAPALVGD